jgi:hypothetical protein
MAVIALTSARGAPGVSTTALAMTLLWPRSALLAECDPAGGSSTLAGYLRGGVEHTRGLLGLAVASRHGQLGEAVLWSETLPLADGPGGSGPSDRWLLPGLSDAAQAPSTAGLWGPLGGVLAGLERAGTDVLVDAGRLGAAHGPTPLLRSADVALLVLGTSLPAVAAARARLGVLRAELGETDGPGPGPLGLLLVGAGRPYDAREISRALGVPVVGSLAWDPAAAEVFSAGAPPGRRFGTAPLVRSTRAAVAAVQELVARRRDRLALPGEGRPQAAPGLAAQGAGGA